LAQRVASPPIFGLKLIIYFNLGYMVWLGLIKIPGIRRPLSYLKILVKVALS
jgi:hypothetical protein